jgi:phosphatidylserine/phosphatidylglycerophosphate/cardiolipin synthase-like enzyme
MSSELILTRSRSAAARIEELVRAASTSIDAALYRFNNPRLADALGEATRDGISVRVVLDRSKYEESGATRELFSSGSIPVRLAFGRRGPGSKMHHKFVIIDRNIVLTGSYNWTVESEEQNFESLLVDYGSLDVAQFQNEFEALWADASPVG